MEDAARRGNGFEVALEVVRRRKWLAVLTFAGVFTAVVSVVTFLPDFYRSSATVIIDRQQIPEEFVKATVTSAVETRLQTISQEILSRSRLEGLINRFGLYNDLKKHLQLEAVIERMRQDIRLELKQVERRGPEGATVAFNISFSGKDPQTVALVTNTLASFYIEENLKARERQAVGTSQFLRVQLEEMKKKLDEQERRVSEFKERYMGELPQQQDANLAILERLNTQLRLNSDSQIRTSEQRAALAKQLAEAEQVERTGAAAVTPDGRPDATVAKLEQRIAELTQTLAELQTRFTDKYPNVIRVKSDLAAQEEQLAKAKSNQEPGKKRSTPPTPYVLQLRRSISEADVEVKALKAEAENLKSSIVLYQQRIETTPRREQEFQGLARDYESTKESYRSLSKRQEEAQLAESMEQRQKGEQFRVIDPAIASAQPTSPNRARLILVGLLLSLGLAAGTVVLAEQLDTSFHKLDELRAFSPLPVLVSIPQIITAADVRRRRWRFGLVAVSAVFGLVVIVGSSYILAHGNEQLVALLARRGA